jgi:hypothetical protein
MYESVIQGCGVVDTGVGLPLVQVSPLLSWIGALGARLVGANPTETGLQVGSPACTVQERRRPIGR